MLISALSPVSVILAILALLAISTLFLFGLAYCRWVARFIVTVYVKAFYRLEVHGQENVPETGGVVLVSNHMSWLDGFLVILVNKRLVHTIVYAANFEFMLFQLMAKTWGAILIGPGPKSIARALKESRQLIADGNVVGIFPEGGISRSGNLQSFKPGVLKVLKGNPDVPVVPIYLDGLWGSIFSFERGKFFWKWPKCWRYPITIHIGKPIHGIGSDIHKIRQAVQQLGSIAVEKRMNNTTSLQKSLIRECKRRRFKSKIADSTGAELTGGSLLMRSLILRRLLRRNVFRDSDTHIGILLPPTVPAFVVNAAVSLDRRVAVNLNYTVSESVMQNCIQQAGIRCVLTSQKVLQKLDMKLQGVEIILLEDLKEKVSTGDKLASLLEAYVYPTSLLASGLGVNQVQPDDVITVIFTSGSTGDPKGVMLTQKNISHNVDAVQTIFRLSPKDAIVAILPFFHSFGYTVTIWAVGNLNIRGLYHFNPLDAKQVGKLVQTQKGTILLSTPTFLRSFLRRCTKEEFATLDTVVAGAEKLPKELSDAFEKKFGFRPVEGYGTTELSPLVSLNVPASRSSQSEQIDMKEGTVGRPAPGVSAKVVDPETREELGVNASGMLLVKGANVMKGYLNQPEKTAEVIQDGWYITGDIAEIDEDGFIRITGRESRFSKIGGEMVPHIKVEETLIEILGVDEDEGPQIAVTAVPDTKKGERLIVLHETINKSPEELCAALRATLPNIFVPSADSFFHVEEVPVLGTGKLDLRAMKDLALELTGSARVAE